MEYRANVKRDFLVQSSFMNIKYEKMCFNKFLINFVGSFASFYKTFLFSSHFHNHAGEFCEIDASVCNSTICKNLGECVEGPGLTFSCHCTDGWMGDYCEDDLDECLIAPCRNGGLCLNTPGSYKCACLFGKTVIVFVLKKINALFLG